MKFLFSLPLLLLLPLGEAKADDDGSFGFSASGGVLFTDPLETIDSSWVILPAVQRWVNPTLAVELAAGFSRGQTRVGIPETFPYTSVTPRVGLLGRVFEDQPLNITLAGGFGAWTKKVADEGALRLPVGEGVDLDFLAYFGPGLMVPLGRGVALRTDLRLLLGMGNDSYQNRGATMLNWEWTAGIAFGVPAGVKDRDGDGIPDEIDRCPDEPEDFDGFEDEDGCPDLDNDGDGIPDEVDECPNEPEDIDGFEDDDGCPDPDNDGDGILDADDLCPDEAGPEATGGCPDSDEDGLADHEDECPNEAGPVESFGCPDADGDRVPDYRDKCPDEAADPRIDPLRSDGCPTRVFFTEKALVITDTIQFDLGRATIKPQSHGLLKDIAELLESQPAVKKVQIEGHTDNTGNPERNQELSEARAQAVMDWLIESGKIDAARLTSKGFGQTRPLIDEETAEAHAANRRVEFNIVEQEERRTLRRRSEVQEELRESRSRDQGEGEATEEEPTEGEERTRSRDAAPEAEAEGTEGEQRTRSRDAAPEAEVEAEDTEGEERTRSRDAAPADE